MPDLSYETVHAFWHEYDPQILYKIVCSIEQSESWIESTPELQSVIQDLGDVLDGLDTPPSLKEQTYIRLLTSIPFAQSLRLMQFLENQRAGTVSSLLMWSESALKTDPHHLEVKTFLRRNIVFERVQLLARIFSQERLDLLMKAKDSAYES